MDLDFINRAIYMQAATTVGSCSNRKLKVSFAISARKDRNLCTKQHLIDGFDR